MVEPVPPSGGAGLLADFQSALKALREQAGNPSFRQMAMKVEVHYSTLARVEEPGRLPTRAAVLAYVEGCRGDLVWWSHQYRDLMRARRTGRAVRFYPYEGAEGAPVEPPEDDPARAARIFAGEMRFLWRQSGLTMSGIAERTRVLARKGRIERPVSVSTVSDLCNPSHGRIPHQSTVRAFLHAIGRDPAEVAWWLEKRLALIVGDAEEVDATAFVASLRDRLAHLHDSATGKAMPQGSIAPRTAIRNVGDIDVLRLWVLDASVRDSVRAARLGWTEEFSQALHKHWGKTALGQANQWLFRMGKVYPLTE
jgi:hypothetical protein